MKTKLISILLLAVATMLSCSTEQSNKNVKVVTTKDSVDLNIAVIPTTDCLPFYVAQEQLVYQKLGLNVKFINYTSLLKSNNAFVKGEVDGAFMTLPTALYLKSTGTPLKLIMKTDGDMDMIANRTKRIKKLSNMRERLVSVTRQSTSEYLTDEIADITKIPSFEILRPQINDIFIRSQMLVNKQIDAVVLPEPYSDLLIMQGHIKVFSTKNSGIKFGCIAFSENILKTKSEKIKLLIKGYEQAAESINNNKKTADSILIKTYHVPVERLDSISIPQYTEIQNIKAKDFEKANQWCIHRKYIKERISENEITTSNFVKK